MTTTPGQTTYDTLPYPSIAFAQTHPDRLAVMARVFGMTPPPAEHCRVLELGCASGGNLIPMAAQLPGATFLGLDLSTRQINDGKKIVAELGLANVELRQMDLGAIDASMGKFDYIIAHGLFSWVSNALQEKILTICNENLVPQGVAYVSYNTYPGWRMRGMVRDMMVYHARQFSDQTQQVHQARALLDFLAQHGRTDDNPYGILLKQEVELLRKQGDSYLAHEYLEEHNEPLYFHQFAERAMSHGLQYLGESELHTMLSSNFPPQVTETLRTIAPEIIRMEQYMDFLRNRVFRQTLLVHQDVTLSRNLYGNSIEGFQVASPMKPVSAKPDLRSAASEQFRTPNNVGLNTVDPIVKATLAILAERWPQAIPIGELRTEARARLLDDPTVVPDPAVAARDAELVGSELLRCVAASLVELRLAPLRLSLTAGERPLADAYARRQATQGMPITNLRHEPVNIDELTRHVLRHLDGQHDRAALKEVLQKLVNENVLSIKQNEQVVRDPAAIRTMIDQALPQCLNRLAYAGILLR